MDGNEHPPNEHDRDLLQIAKAMSPDTPSEQIHRVLIEEASRSDPTAGLVKVIAERVRVSPEQLSRALHHLREVMSFPPAQGGTALAVDLLRHYRHGLLLRAMPDGGLHRYVGTHWMQLPESSLRQDLTRTALRRPELYGDNANAAVDAAVKIIRALRAEDNPSGIPAAVINVRNAELWILPDGTFEARRHRPESGLGHVLPITFDPDATCPLFDIMLSGIFANAADPDAMVRHLLELMAYAIQPVRDIPTIAILQGGGGNGKTKVLEILAALVGPDQTLNGSIETLSRDRFLLPDLAGKLLFIQDDAGDGVKLDDSLLKKIAENKDLDARRVRASRSVRFRATVLPILAMNGSPAVKDSSHGFERRLRVIPFTRRFTAADKDDTLAPSIIRDELPGVLNLLLAAMHRLRARGGFDEPLECIQARDELLAASNPLRAFLHEACRADPKDRATVRQVWNAFSHWCTEQKKQPSFARYSLKARLVGMGYVVRKSNGEQVVDGLALN